mgnify:CR=1 FL=1|jgi:hypothetical protein
MTRRIVRRTFTRFRAVAAVLLVSAALTGCLYPKDQLAQNRMPPRDAVRLVQAAVDDYRRDTGLLPIRNADPDTPKYEKYVVDLAKLKRTGYLSDLPAAAYEKGGNYYFLVLDEETEPTVRLLNVAVLQRLNDLQARVAAYMSANGGALPAGEPLYPSFAVLDYDKLGGGRPDIRSVFSGLPINVLVHDSGELFADYAADIRRLVESAGAAPDPETDLRELLARETLFVPVKSPVYHWIGGDPSARYPEP